MMTTHYDKQLSEKSRENDRRKFVLMGASASLLLLLVVGTVAANNYQEAEEAGKGKHSTRMNASAKSVEMICSSTDFTSTCVSSISKVVPNDTEDPKVLIKAAVTVVLDEVSNAFAHSKLLQSNDSRVRGAVQDCQELYENSKEEINATLQSIVDHAIDKLPTRSSDMRTWLSAVIAYQQTCIDGFPDGELKTRMKEAMKSARELTSNALAIIGQASSFLSLINLSARRRRLLVEEEEVDPLAAEASNGVPSWFSDDDRRMLKHHIKIALTPDVTVAKDGSGDYTTINNALAAMPKKYKGRYVIYVKAGIYAEYVNITKKMANVTMYGDGSTKSIITGDKNYVDGTRTFQTATFLAAGNGFIAIGLAFRNTAGPHKHQAVALRVTADRSVFFNCRMEGYQDTLYAHSHRQFYRACVITGTIDFIFGDSAAVFQNCILVVRRPMSNQQNIITAQGRSDRRETTGFVLQHCYIRADSHLLDPSQPPIRSFLARPWKEFSKTIIMESEINDFIHSDGFLPWEGDFALTTLHYAEFNNRGPGANTTARVKWPGVHVIDRGEALRYTVKNFIQGDSWIPASGAPVSLGLVFSAT